MGDSMSDRLVLTNAEEAVENGTRVLQCGFCGYKWAPRKKVPKQCPNCKRNISASQEMVDIHRKKVIARLPLVKDVRTVVPDYFTPQCECGEEATVSFDGRFMCGKCLNDELKRRGLAE